MIYIFILSVLPGAWLTFGLPLEELRWRVRLALGVALSPAVLGIQLIAMKLIGLDFGWAAPILVITNLPSALLIISRMPLRRRSIFPRTSAFGGLIFVLLAFTLILPWLLVPDYRTFSWHGLMHTDMVYQITRNTLLPEEPELAGFNLSYPWVGHTYWAIAGWLSDWPPTFIYPLSNLIWLLATTILVYDLARLGLHLHQSISLLSVGLTFLGTNIIGLIIRLVANDGNLWWYWMGLRFSPILEKFRGFEVMPFAFAILVGLTLVCLLGVQKRIRLLWVIAACLQIALGLIYPIFLPVGYILVGVLVLLLLGQSVKGIAWYNRKEILLLILGQVLTVIISAVYLMVITQNHTDSAFQLAQSGRKAKTVHLIVSLSPFLITSLPFIIVSFRRRAAAPILLIFTGICSMGLYALVYMGENEYKYIYAATFMFAPLSAAGLGQIIQKFPRGRWALAFGLPLFLILINLLFFFRLGVQIPKSLENAPKVSENSFWLSLSPTEEDAVWIQTIRSTTPSDTILISQGSHIHIGPFVERSLYIPSDLNGEMTSGYSLSNQLYLLGQRGYPETVYQQRLQVSQILFNDREDLDGLIFALGILRDLNRPLAIHFSDISAPSLKWLEKLEIGTMLFADKNDIVWFIDQGELSNSRSRLPAP